MESIEVNSTYATGIFIDIIKWIDKTFMTECTKHKHLILNSIMILSYPKHWMKFAGYNIKPQCSMHELN